MSDDNKALTTYDPQFDIKIELDKPAEPANVSEAQADYYSIEWPPPRILQNSLVERIALLLFEQDQARKERANNASAKL